MMTTLGFALTSLFTLALLVALVVVSIIRGVKDFRYQRGYSDNPTHPKSGKILLASWAVCALLMGSILFNTPTDLPQEPTVSSEPVKAEASEPAPSEPAPVEKLVTVEKLEQLEEGMTYEQVVEVMGEEGEFEAESKSLSSASVTYSWNNKGPGFVIVSFDKDEDGGTSLRTYNGMNLQ